MTEASDQWTPEDWARLGVRVKVERERQRLSRAELADRAGVSLGSVRSAELGVVPKARWPQSLGAIERALGWDMGSVQAVLVGDDPQASVRTAATVGQSDWARLGVRIAEQRKWLRWDQKQLAEAAGVSENTIGNYERGRIPSRGRLPSGYYRVELSLNWPDGTVDSLLAGGEVGGAESTPRETSNSDVVAIPTAVFDDLIRVAAHVSVGRWGAFAQESPYPEVSARRALGALHEAGLLPDVEPSGDPR